MSKQYRVKALSMNGGYSKIYNAGDIIPEDAMPEGHAQEMVDKGFLEPYTGKFNEHSDSAGTPHIVTAADVARNPGAGFTEGETVYLPLEGFAMDDAVNQATNESGEVSHTGGKVLVPLSEAKGPDTPVVPPAEPVKTDATVIKDATVILPSSDKAAGVANQKSGNADKNKK